MRKVSLQGKITFWNVILTFLILFITLTINLQGKINLIEDKIESNITNVSNIIAINPLVINSLKENKHSDNMIKYLDEILEYVEDIDIIVISDNNGKRYYHPNKDLIGEKFVGGDEERVIKSGEVYSSNAIGTLGDQKRFFAPIKDENDNQIGFIMVSALTKSINKLKIDIVKKYTIVGTIIFSLCIIISVLISRGIKKTLLGYEPEQITKLYIQRREVLSALEEGIIAIDKNGKIIIFNEAAINILKIKKINIEGEFIQDILPETKLLNIIETKIGKYNQEMVIHDIVIITDRIPIIENNEVIGAVAIFRNKTEVTKLAEELTGVNQIIEALRANNHEFMNKLHIILGLLHMKKVEEAKAYIAKVNNEQREIISIIMNKIKDPQIAALILGKVSRAKESGIKLTLDSNSFLQNNNNYLSRNDLITILGNLIENAIDSINEKDDDVKDINLLIFNNDECLMINVYDTGCGVSKENIDKIYNRGFSTKGNSRGTGLNLVKNIVDRYNGEIEVETEEYEGTCFTIRINN